ncbi:MAG: phosphotransferase family protein [Candidatus Actinomarinales bacterium]|nr:MAG: phosphotransferase family protein [Candidatus Actinomarinales bacterium]|tara:strand:+ start:7208 stop:8224 length:1017 start_codon:yes stop_codon:yes gene_type:complete
MDFFNNQIRELIVKNIEIDKNFQYEQFKVGRSNITFKIFDDKNSYVLRRPPYGNKLESAHNMSREYRIIDELSKNNLKVPKPIFLYTEKDISDDDFYIMEYIEGKTISDNIEAELLSTDEKITISNSFIKTIADIHNFDVVSSKLEDLGKHQGYVERQLNRWTKQFEAQKVREIDDLDHATELLFENIPKQQKISIVHGDYRLDNVRVNNGSVAAVVDWELCTIGDPLADIGTIIASWSNSKEKDSPFIYSPTLSDGFLSRSKLLEIYSNNSDLDLRNIEFYVRLSYWKHAMIMEGVYVRYSRGSYGNINEKEIELFKESTVMFAKKAANKNLLKEIK